MGVRSVWFISPDADPAKAYDKAYYSIREVAERHCRNLRMNTGPGWQVHEAVVVLKSDFERAAQAWTSERPTVPGWYWNRNPDEPQYARPVKVTLLDLPIPDWTGWEKEWAGPIFPPPSPPPAGDAAGPAAQSTGSDELRRK